MKQIITCTVGSLILCACFGLFSFGAAFATVSFIAGFTAMIFISESHVSEAPKPSHHETSAQRCHALNNPPRDNQ